MVARRYLTIKWLAPVAFAAFLGCDDPVGTHQNEQTTLALTVSRGFSAPIAALTANDEPEVDSLEIVVLRLDGCEPFNREVPISQNQL